MKTLTVTCAETELLPTEGQGYALAVELQSAGDEDVPISGVFLCRKGLNAFPEFAAGFGLNPTDLIEGLEPERYQVRVEMLASHKGLLLYGDGKSEFRLPPGKKVKFVMPLPFQMYHYFLNAPPEDLFIAAASLSEENHCVEVSGLHEVIRQSIEAHGHLGSPYNVNFSLIVPQKSPPSEDMLKAVGTTNENPCGTQHSCCADFGNTARFGWAASIRKFIVGCDKPTQGRHTSSV
jgi:hypothetical protein